MVFLVSSVDFFLRVHPNPKYSMLLAKATFPSLTRRRCLQEKKSLTRRKGPVGKTHMITTILVTLAVIAVAVGSIVVTVAKAIAPLDHGDLSLRVEFSGPPEAAPAFAEWQRLDLQYCMAEELGGLDAGSLETLRQDVAMARARYETVLAQAAVVELSPQEQLDAAAAVGDCLSPQQLRDAEAAVSDCLSPSPSIQPALALGVAASAVPVRNRRSDS